MAHLFTLRRQLFKMAARVKQTKTFLPDYFFESEIK